MAQVVDELVTILGFDMDGKSEPTLRKFNMGISSITKYAKMASLAVTAAATSIIYFGKQANDASDEVEKLGRVTGISTDTIQDMSFALEQVGGSISTMHSDLESLMMSMNSPIPGEFNQGLFLLEISTKKANGELKKVDEVLLDIADKMQGMSKQRQMQWGQKIGISKDTIMLLQEGRQEIERLRKQAEQIPVIVDLESLRNAREFNRQLSLIGRVVDFFGKSIASVAGPAVKDIVDDLMKWATANQKLIHSRLGSFLEGTIRGFKKFIRSIRTVKTVIGDLIPEIGDFTKKLTGIEKISIVVYSVLIALSIPLGILIVKFLLIAAVITAAGLVIEDFLFYLEGSDSAIGRFIKAIDDLWKTFSTKYPEMSGFIEDFIDGLKSFGSYLSSNFFPLLKEFMQLLEFIAKGWGLLADLAQKQWDETGFGEEGDTNPLLGFGVLKKGFNMWKDTTKTVMDALGFGEDVSPIEEIEPTQQTKEPIRKKVKRIQETLTYTQKKTPQTIEPIQETVKPIQETVKPIQETVKPIQETVGFIQQTTDSMYQTFQDIILPIQENIEQTIKSMSEPKFEEGDSVKTMLGFKTLQEGLQGIALFTEGDSVKTMLGFKSLQEGLDIVSNFTEGEGNMKAMLGFGVHQEGLSTMSTFMKELKEALFNFGTPQEVSSQMTSVSTNNRTTSEQSIVNNVAITVTGDNAPAIASEVSHKLNTTLQQLYPGGLAPAVQ